MSKPEIITLLSSPPQSPGKHTVKRSELPVKTHRSYAHIDDSYWNDLLSPIEKPAKRRKLSPIPQAVSTKSVKSSEAIFELSSEPDVDLPIRKTRATNTIEDKSIAIHDLDEFEDVMPSLSSPGLLPERSTFAEQVRTTRHTVQLLSDDVVDISDTIGSPIRPTRAAHLVVPAATAALLEKVNKKAKKHPASSRTVTSFAKTTKSMRSSHSSMEVLDNIIDSSQTSPKKKTNSTVKEDAHSKPAARQKKTSTEKEAEKERKRLEKERKAAEKQKATDIAEVNRRKTDKAKAVDEIIIDVPNTLRGKSLGNKIEEEIKTIGANHCYYADEVNLTEAGDVRRLGNIIKWRRKIPSTYDEALEEWVPVQSKKVESEKHILVHLPAEDFCLIATLSPSSDSADATPHVPTEEDMMTNLDTYMTVLRSRFPKYTIIILIEGLAQWLKKNASAKNREYAAAVREQINTGNDASTTAASGTQAVNKASRKRKNQVAADLAFFTNDIIENLMLHLQLVHRPLHIHHTTTSECYRQIVTFTQHLSTRPYRNVELDRNIAHASFCMASGQFRTGGGDPADTWIKMLEQLNRLTIPYAKGIWDAGYESPAQLVKGFKKVEKSLTGGGQSLGGGTSLERQARDKAKLMLEDVRRSNSDKRIGPQVSKRLYKVFMSKDEDLRDGIA